MDVPTTTNTCVHKLNVIVNVLQPFVDAHVFKDDVRVRSVWGYLAFHLMSTTKVPATRNRYHQCF